MRKKINWLLLPCILFFYAFLYIATTKDCKVCPTFDPVQVYLSSDSTVVGGSQCQTAIFCIYIKKDANRNWQTLADSTCLLLNQSGTPNFTVAIIREGNNGDTLFKKKCQ